MRLLPRDSEWQTPGTRGGPARHHLRVPSWSGVGAEIWGDKHQMRKARLRRRRENT